MGMLKGAVVPLGRLSDRKRIEGGFATVLPLYWLDFLLAISVGMVPPLLPVLAAHWALSTVQAGLIYTVYAVGRLGSCYPASDMRARWGTRTALVGGIASLTLGLLTCGLSSGFTAFLAGRFLMGVGMSAAFLALLAELLERSPAVYRGRFTNAFEGVTITSQSVGSFAVGPLALAIGWRGSFAVAGAIALLGLTTWRRIGPLAGRRSSSATRVVQAAGRREPRGLAPVYGASFAMALTWSGLFSTLAPLVGHHHYGLNLAALGIILATTYLAELVGLLGLTFVVDRIRREPVFMLGAASVALGGIVLAASVRPAFFVVGLALVGLGFAVSMIPAALLADWTGGRITPWHLAAYRISTDAGMIFGPLVSGGLAHLTGERTALGLAGLVLVGGGLGLVPRVRVRVGEMPPS